MKEITIPSPAGDIYAVLSPAVGETSSDKPLVVICHGLMMNSWLNPVRGISDGFNAAGYDTLRFDFRGSGQSTGNVTEMTPLTEVGDLQAVISYVQLALTRNIILCGHSLGGLVSLITAAGLEQEVAATATSISLVFLSALLTGLNLYHRIARFGGAGTLVPITGFANAVVSPAIDFKAEGFVTGMAAKMFLVAGPVIVFGTVASALYGLILWLVG